MLNFNDQGRQFLSSAKSRFAPWRKPEPRCRPVHARGLWGGLLHGADTALGRDSHCRQLPAELDEVLPFLLYPVSPWSPGGVPGARRSQPGEERGAVGTAAANPSSSSSQARNGRLWWDTVSPISNSAPGMLPVGAEHRGGHPTHPGMGIMPPSPAGGSPARWFSLQPLTHLPKMPALTSWQETATGKW